MNPFHLLRWNYKFQLSNYQTDLEMDNPIKKWINYSVLDFSWLEWILWETVTLTKKLKFRPYMNRLNSEKYQNFQLRSLIVIFREIHPSYHYRDFPPKMVISAWKWKFRNFSKFSLYMNLPFSILIVFLF